MNRAIGELAHDFWKNAERSKLAPEVMYKKQHSILNTYILPYFEEGSTLLDIGCSDGEFTQVLARDCKEATGVDLSENLITLAKAKYGSSGKIKFEVLDLLKDGIAGHFNIVSCMGVLTCLPNKNDFKKVVNDIDRCLIEGGYLVVKDSLMLKGDNDFYYNNNSYEAIYRAESNYLREFEQYGYNLLQRHLLHQGNNASQVSVLYLFRKPAVKPKALPPKKPTDVRLAILYQLPESWCNVESIWQSAQSFDGLECYLIVSPFLHQDIGWQKNKVLSMLTEKGIPFIFFDEIDIEGSHFDVFLYTSPYDSTRPVELCVDVVKPKVGSIAYIPYGLEVGGGAANLRYQYGQPVALQSSNIFVRSDSAKKMFSKYCPIGDSHVVVTGHPRMDRLYNLAKFEVDADLVEAVGQKTAILWNAHFSFDKDMWSTFDIFAEAMLKFAHQHQDSVLIFRPHPFLWNKLVNLNIFTPNDINNLKAELSAMGIIIDEREDYRHAFAVSSILVSDVGSFLLEYLATGKPVVYLKNIKGFGLNDEGNALIDFCYQVENVAQLHQKLEHLLAKIDEKQNQRLAAIPELFSHFDGKSGQRVLESLFEYSMQRRLENDASK